jgi:MYXO-CTERM domain-containing protein
MRIPAPQTHRTRLLAWITLLVATLLASTALAYGTVKWKKTQLKEESVGTQSHWKIELEFYLPKAPDMAMVPVKFEFMPTVYYERYRDDSSPNVQTRSVPLNGQQAIIESVDLGFMDPGTGKIENRTRFAFRITRAHGFQGGEYRVTIRDGRNGQTIGTPVTLKLDGENEVIDRRAISFAGDDKKKSDKKADDAGEGDDQTPVSDDPLDTGNQDDSNWQEVDHRDDPLPPPEGLQKGHGCGCRTAGTKHPAGLVIPALLGAALLGRRLRRRRAA